MAAPEFLTTNHLYLDTMMTTVPHLSPARSLGGEWRLFTKEDLQATLAIASCDDATLGRNGPVDPARPHLHVSADHWPACLQTLTEHTEKLHYQHDSETASTIPRANVFRPYRLTLGPHVVAVLVVRASEAYGLSEVDVLVTCELPGVAPLAVTRAALMFVICDSIRHGGSLAVQFTRRAAPAGLPPHVRAAAAAANVPLSRAAQGTITPDEARELLLRWSGLDDDDQQRARELARRGVCSLERLGFLLARGLWSAMEVSLLLRNLSCPELLLGLASRPVPRHLATVASDLGRAALLGGVLTRALQQLPPLAQDNDQIIEPAWCRHLSPVCDADHLALRVPPLTAAPTLVGWQIGADEPWVVPSERPLVATLRPRAREALRMHLAHDIDAAAAAASASAGSSGGRSVAVLVCAADLRDLSASEHQEIEAYAQARHVKVLAGPLTCAGLDGELRQRLTSGRTVRS
ncbi:MAG: hypothetical protein U0935_15260 [Pirellulales bacterium]